MINKFFDKAAGTELEQFLLGVADLEFKSYFFADCSRLAYHDGRVAKKYFKRVGFTTHKFFDVEGAQCHIAQTKEIINNLLLRFNKRIDSFNFYENNISQEQVNIENPGLLEKKLTNAED